MNKSREKGPTRDMKPEDTFEFTPECAQAKIAKGRLLLLAGLGTLDRISQEQRKEDPIPEPLRYAWEKLADTLIYCVHNMNRLAKDNPELVKSFAEKQPVWPILTSPHQTLNQNEIALGETLLERLEVGKRSYINLINSKFELADDTGRLLKSFLDEIELCSWNPDYFKYHLLELRWSSFAASLFVARVRSLQVKTGEAKTRLLWRLVEKLADRFLIKPENIAKYKHIVSPSKRRAARAGIKDKLRDRFSSVSDRLNLPTFNKGTVDSSDQDH